MAATWQYDGTGTLIVSIDDAIAGDYYELSCSDSGSAVITAVATGASLTMTTTGVGGDGAGFLFGAYIYHGDSSSVSTSDPCLYDNIFSEGTGSTSGHVFTPVTWVYNGTNSLAVTFTAVGGVTYELDAYTGVGLPDSTTAGPFTGGTSHTITLTTTSPTDPAGKSFVGLLQNHSDGNEYCNRIFVGGVASAGASGNPTATPTQNPAGRVLIAFDDGPLVANPTWTVIDQGGLFPNSFVSGYDITSGRQTLLAQTDTGSATVYINDHDLALFDPRNASSPYFQKLDGRQIMLQLYDPIAASWESQFRGHIDNVTYDIDDASDENGDPVNASIQLECVDIFDYLAGYGLTPGLDGVLPTLPGSEDSVYYAQTTGTVDDRIIEILADVLIDSTRSIVFSGNVSVQETKYNADESALTALRDAADAEFPFIANLYVDRQGRVVFHGRYGRFDPDGVAADAGTARWDFHNWQLGDGKAVLADATRTQIRVLSYGRGRSEVINVAVAYPANTPPAQMPSQVYADTTSIEDFGKHAAPPMSDLLVERGIFDSTANYPETLMYAELLVKNQKDPRESITAIQLKSINPSTPRAANVWSCLTKSDVSDTVNVKVGYPDGTGFTGGATADRYFVEGRQMTVRPANASFDYVELNLELSPFVWSADTHSVFPARA